MTSNYNHQEAPISYPPPQTSYFPATEQGYARGSPVMAPPPMGYPTYSQEQHNGSSGKTTTTNRGDGFWKGCCAALCCCCMLDACF